MLPAEPGVRRIIGDGEEVADGEVEGLGDVALLDLYRGMVLLRTYDERSLVYHRQGRIGTYAIFWGHEAIQAGSALALADEDWIFPSYRESAIGLLRGMPPETILKGRSDCAIAYFGDGATSEGAFHEGANFAAVMRAPAVLLCNNNQWAISTPLSAQKRAESLADKAVGYGMPGVRVDGGDVLAVYEATTEALARARAGDGPTFIEALTYRAAPHATADDPSAYWDEERVEEERRNECLGRFDRYLRRAGVLTDALAEQIKADALGRMKDGIAAVEALPPPDPEVVFAHAYVDPPPSLRDG